ncbi:MAG TPA: UrcA family protein [Phenylobacterium sp.]
MKHRRVGLLVAALALTGASAVRADPDGGETRHVHAEGLNLKTPEGVAILRQRVDGAVKAVCGEADLRDIARSTIVKRCRRDTAELAAPKIDQLIATAGGTRLAQLTITKSAKPR